MKVKGFLLDIGGASRVTNMRREKFEQASSKMDPVDPIRELADALHPGKQEFTITEIRDASPTAKTYRFSPVNGHVPVFYAGQYANFYFTIGASVLTRPYTISSAPYEARLSDPYFEITIRRNVPYFAPDNYFEHLTVGSTVTASLPFGHFYYEPLRDAKKILALAGGSGITPFVSMAWEIVHGGIDAEMTILYGSVRHTDIVCGDDLARAAQMAPDKIRLVHVMSDDPEWDGEKGFITKELIDKYSDGDTSYFFCGPLAMYGSIEKSMKEMGIGPRRFRHDVMSQPSDVEKIPGFSTDQIGKTYTITVRRGIQEDRVFAKAEEPVAVALERAGIPVDTHCRGGECGFCRSQLLAGDIFVSPLGDGRRAMDKELGWFHACSAYPQSDLTIKIPIL